MTLPSWSVAEAMLSSLMDLLVALSKKEMVPKTLLPYRRRISTTPWVVQLTAAKLCSKSFRKWPETKLKLS